MTPLEPTLSLPAPLSESHRINQLVHAISEDAKLFYKHWGFVETPYNPVTLVARLKDLA